MLKALVGMVAGLLAGMGIGYLSRQAGSACPIACDYYTMPILGAVFGLLMSVGGERLPDKPDRPEK